MATAPTVIRRYTPPTCTLEITAQPSALSRWMGKVALKDVRFKLSFDDPRISDDAWVVIRGDRAQLEGLNTTVSDYVQSFLMRAPALPTATVERDIAAQTAVSATDVATPIAPSTAITIQPKGWLGHELVLGSLATAQSGATLELSSTQLADLAAALDEYSAEAITLPSLTRQSAWLPDLKQWSSPNWAGLAAGLLVAVGLGTSLVNGLSRQSPSSGTVNQASSSDQRLAVPSVPAVSPTSESFATLPPLAALPPSATLPPPGSNINPTGMAPGSTMPNSAPSAPIIANQPSSGTQSQVNIFEIPQPVAPKVAAPSAPSKPSATAANPPLPVIVDDIGSGVTVEPIPDMTQAEASRSAAPRAQTEAPAASSLSRNRAAESPNKTAAAPSSSGNDNFMGNDQAAAVQRYFQQRWQPQKDLNQGIQYEIQLNPDGSLKQAKPLGTVAEEFQAKTGIPAVGTALAPAAQDGQPAIVRLLLDPDGSVQAIPQ